MQINNIQPPRLGYVYVVLAALLWASSGSAAKFLFLWGCCFFAFALYSLKSEYGMRSYKPWTVVFYAPLFAAVTWNVLAPLSQRFP